MPISDVEEEGVFTNIYTGKTQEFLPWHSNQPNGNEGENHVVVEHSTLGYWDIKENHKSCVLCDVKPSTEFYLRGPCEDSYLGCEAI